MGTIRWDVSSTVTKFYRHFIVLNSHDMSLAQLRTTERSNERAAKGNVSVLMHNSEKNVSYHTFPRRMRDVTLKTK